VINNAQNEACNEESYGAVNPGCNANTRCCGHGLGAGAEESSPDRLLIHFTLVQTRNYSANFCVNLVTWRGKTLSLSGDLQRENESEASLADELVRLKGDAIVRDALCASSEDPRPMPTHGGKGPA
jgi:hypothetical protein